MQDVVSQPGQLTILDLSCPCVTAEMACSLFNICLSIFLEQNTPASIGRVIALDEAHKYMGDSAECQSLTDNLLRAIRLQRHLGSRVFISTQEPTISPKLLDLCSVTIVHRFTSPGWLKALEKHVAGVSTVAQESSKAGGPGNVEKAENAEKASSDIDVATLSLGKENPTRELFSRIIGLLVGEALLFAPTAAIGIEDMSPDSPPTATSVKWLGHGILKVRIRKRVTADGGRTILAL